MEAYCVVSLGQKVVDEIIRRFGRSKKNGENGKGMTKKI